MPRRATAPADGLPADGLPPPSGHLPTLDGLRGIAILLVLVHHSSMLDRPWTHTLDGVAAKMQQTTWCGVDLFFVLSGFLITGILHDAKEGASQTGGGRGRGGLNYFRSFYARRALRIFPLYYAFLVLIVYVIPLLPFALPAQALMPAQWWYWTYLSNYLFARTGMLPPGVGHLWSLAIEEQFYFIWPVVVLVLGRTTLMRVCVGIMAGSLVLRAILILNHTSWVVPYTVTPARMDALACGAWIALAARGLPGLARVRPLAGPVTAAATVVLGGVFVVRRGLASQDPLVQSIGFTAIALLFGATLVRAVTTRPGSSLDRLLTGRVLVAFGRYSYALYLFHFPLAYLATRAGLGPRAMPRVGGWQLPAQIAYFVAFTSVSFALSFLSWHLFEKHFLKLKRIFPYARRRPLQPADLRQEADALSAP